MRRRTRTNVTATTAALLLALGACTGDGGGGGDGERSGGRPDASRTPGAAGRNTAPQMPSAAELNEIEQAVGAYTAAYFEPDVDAGWAMLSKECRKQDTKAGFAVLLERARRGNVHHERYYLRRFEVQRMVGDRVVVTYGVGPDPKFDRTEQWVREAGWWRYDHCFGLLI
ncbi:hypothetical protein H9Y04_41880 [Streptomyces sp. TRM66268-LWL]|uniref:Lipoprotein n=1 Tax=Streptomyces polyasparticus TaxID=2767826 RepID=A0ABR7SUK9_9ACTN|nr:hypothetical protein [Streptomyces polyasparticus]MBC9719088.1 hypothetical protein [Streptomyces polyasparticus]